MEQRMRKWLIGLICGIIGLPIALILFLVAAFRLVNRTNGTLVSSGKKRAYLLYVPQKYDPSIPTPLVISLHGYAEWPAHQMQISRWNDLADQYGFIVVYPSGTHFPLRWRTRRTTASDSDPMLDVKFISDLIDQLERTYRIDPARIYANGLSNGGGMAFVLSATLSERIAAVGLVSGAYLYPWEACSPSRRVPAVVFHGTSDRIVPFRGGPSRAFALPFPPIPEWIDTLACRNGCDETPLKLPSQGEASGVRFMNGMAEVLFYTITGGGHAWPGGKPMPRFIVGHTTQDIDATQVMWDFFQQHPLPRE
jgi:polyhydroxybutyrate depolymerase